MKAPLLCLTVPYVTLFLSGFFDWYLDDGFIALMGFVMLAGLVWAWIVEFKRVK